MARGFVPDWYQATIEEVPSKAVSLLIDKLGVGVRENPSIGRMYHYEQGYEIISKQGETVAKVACGRDIESGNTHAFASSENAIRFMEVVREAWPDRHLVTRADSCIDFVDRTAYPRLVGIGRRIAKLHRVAFPSIRDVLNPTAGRTQYVGSKSSEFQGRIYEKGYEMLSKIVVPQKLRAVLAADKVESIRVPGQDFVCHPSELVRAELVCRVKDEEGRRVLARCSPEEMWAMAKWPMEFAHEALALDLERVFIRTRKYSSDEKALRWMVTQYGGPLTRQVAELGDWSCLGLQLQHIYEEIQKQEKEAGMLGYSNRAPH